MRKRIISLLCVVALLVGLLPAMTFADDTAYEAGLCEHHQQHDENCGYSEGTEEVPCNHQHDEQCGGLIDPTNCNHEHNEECGYVPAKAGTPCIFVCEICNGEKEAEKCICETLCTEDGINADCPVCAAEGAKLDEVCTGTAPMTLISTRGLEENLAATVEIDGKTTSYYVGDGTGAAENEVYKETAEEAFQAAWSACGGKTATLTLKQDVALSEQLRMNTLNTKLTLCMDDDVKLTSSATIALSISSSNRLDFQSGTIEVNTTSNSNVTAVYCNNSAAFTLSGGTIEMNVNSTGKLKGISASGNTTITLSSGQIICDNNGTGSAYGVDVYASTFHMTGGSITAKATSGASYGVYLEGSSSPSGRYGVATISGGQYCSNKWLWHLCGY